MVDFTSVPTLFQNFIDQFDPGEIEESAVSNGFFGHTSFDGVQYFDTLKFDASKRRFDTPDINSVSYTHLTLPTICSV